MMFDKIRGPIEKYEKIVEVYYIFFFQKSHNKHIYKIYELTLYRPFRDNWGTALL